MAIDPTKSVIPKQREALPKSPEVLEKEKHLKDYLEGMEKMDPKENREFFVKTMEWERNGDFESLRKAGRSADENKDDNKMASMKKHVLLSSLYLQRDLSKPGELAFKIKFDSDLANRKIGLGDMAPPEAKSLKVWNDTGEVVCEDAFRAINPETGRIGYYDRKAYEETKTYRYIAVFDNYSFSILTTGDYRDPVVARHKFAEHRELYESRREQASGTAPSAAPAVSGQTGPARAIAGGERAPGVSPATTREAPRRTMEVASNYATINGEKYEMGGQWLWQEAIGGIRYDKASKKLTVAPSISQKLSLDPLTGGPLTFLGRPLRWRNEKTGEWFPIKVNKYIIPFLKEAEARMRAAGVDYDITMATCFNPREVRGREGTGTLSEHAWGTAIDFNSHTNPWKSRRTDMPIAFIQIMEECGFKWGGDWSQFGKRGSDIWKGQFGRPDPMHFQFQLNPGKANGLLKSEEAKRYAAKCLDDWPVDTKAKAPAEAQYAQNPASGKTKTVEAGRGVSNKMEKVRTYESMITEAAQKHNVPKNLIMAVMYQESGGDPLIASHAGAGGLMQLMPATARGMGLKNVYDMVATRNSKGRMTYRLDPRDDRADPYKCIMVGAKILSGLLKRHKGNIELALASYNWGSGNVDKYQRGEKQMPAETRNYIANVPRIYNSLEAAEQKSA